MRRLLPALAALMVLAAVPTAEQRNPGARRPADRSQGDLRPHQGSLRPGDLAPDFALEPPGGGEPVTLSSFRGKPVALVFGSYT